MTAHDAGGESARRAELIARLDAYGREWEESILSDFVEGVLSIRLTTVQLKVLALVVPEPSGSTVQELAGALDVTLATMSGVVDRLEGHGMIARSLDATDHRVRRVTATQSGRDVIRTLATAQPPGLPDLLAHLATEDLAALAQGLGALFAVARCS